MSLATYYLDYGRHVARLRRRRRRAYAPTSNTASHDNHEKSSHGFPSLFYTCLSMGLRLAAAAPLSTKDTNGLSTASELSSIIILRLYPW